MGTASHRKTANTPSAHACRHARALPGAVLQGRSGITQIEGFPCEDFSTRFAGEIKGFDPTGYIDKKNARRMDSCIKYTMVAGKKARGMLCFAFCCTVLSTVNMC